jgi:hypothetical protein
MKYRKVRIMPCHLGLAETGMLWAGLLTCIPLACLPNSKTNQWLLTGGVLRMLTAAGTVPVFHRIPFSGAAGRTTCVNSKDTSYLDGGSIFTAARLRDFLTQARNLTFPTDTSLFLHPAAGQAPSEPPMQRMAAAGQKPGRRAQGFSAR